MLPLVGTYSVASLALAVAAFVLLVGGTAAEGIALLALASFYCAVAALVFRRDRDFATVLWVPALAVALVAFAEPLSGTWLVLAWAATSAAAAFVADRAGERRLQVAALAYLLPALAHAIWFEAPPSDFFESTRHPASGVPASPRAPSSRFTQSRSRSSGWPRRSEAEPSPTGSTAGTRRSARSGGFSVWSRSTPG